MTVERYDHEAEQSVLGALLLDPGAIAQVRDLLTPEDFHEPRHAVLYRAALALEQRGEPIDVVTLRAELGENVGRAGGIDYIAELSLVVPSSVSVGAYAEIVAEHATRRRLVAAGKAIMELDARHDRPVIEVVGEAQRIAMAVQRQGRTRSTSLYEAMTSAWGGMNARENRTDGITSGFSRIDHVTHGFHRGELTVLGARPSVGKSALAVNMAVAAASKGGARVLVASLEMRTDSLAIRVLSAEAGVDKTLLDNGNASSDDYANMARAIDRHRGTRLTIDDQHGRTIGSLRSLARAHASKHGLDFLIVDYLQLLRADTPRLRPIEAVSEISAGLKDCARELDIPVLALSQLSRESEKDNRRPRMSDLRESGALEQDADVILLLWRPGMNNPEEDASKTECIIAKNRNGPTTTVLLQFRASRTEFRDSYVPPIEFAS